MLKSYFDILNDFNFYAYAYALKRFTKTSVKLSNTNSVY